jgi:xanthine dehydrogenase accessory factor
MRRVETDAGTALIEAWVPSPRLVVVGSGEVVAAIDAQAGLLGWETRSTDTTRDVEELLEWAGSTGALIVLSHDPHVDVPVLKAGLRRPTPYVGAMGSRGTQSRRLQRLEADGVGPEDLNRIHRPIGLNLGGRRAAEVALAIVAEILACHCGRDARPLSATTGSIHG